MTKVIVGSGFAAQSPHAGGVFSVVLQYLLGLRRLGCEVCWLELLWPEGGDDRPLIRRFMRQLADYGLERDCCLIYFPQGAWRPRPARHASGTAGQPRGSGGSVPRRICS
jgi:hypothetical protein